MKTLREMLLDIEKYSYQLSTDMVSHVVENYQRVLNRKKKSTNNSLKKIIKKLSLNEKFAHVVYVDKKYTKADLLKDLRKLEDEKIL